MSRGAVLPMQSYQLAAYAMPLRCFICEADNVFDAEFCTYCSAPMSLARQAKSQKAPPQMIAVLGASGVGKTVYLGTLMDMLSREDQPTHLLSRGAFSITLQQITVAALSRCEFPDKTANEPEQWNWAYSQVSRGKKDPPLELIMPDMGGEALLEEADHPHSFRVIQRFLQKCAGAMLLIDSPQLDEETRQQDFFAMKLLSYLSELDTGNRRTWSQRPIAMVLTKADECEACLENPAAYAWEHANGLWQHCKERFRQHKFFSASVAGAVAWRESPTRGRRQVPLRIEPHGIVEPLEWLLERLSSGKKKLEL